jgi:hypothetical protein
MAAAPVAEHHEPEVHISATQFRPVFLQTPGNPPIPWQHWRRMFADWVGAIGFPNTPPFAVRKAALLRASLGAEGSRIYYTLIPDDLEETYDEIMTRMGTQFNRPAGVIFNRALFSRHLQKPGDSVMQYLSSLRELARRCNFQPDQFDERIRDQFAAGPPGATTTEFGKGYCRNPKRQHSTR